MSGGSAKPVKGPGDLSSRERAEPQGGSAKPTTPPVEVSSRERAKPRKESGIKVSALDHVHIYVADLDAAVDWYGRILGLVPHPSTSQLDQRGISGVYMATSRGQYCATFFEGKPPSDGDHTTAFRVPGRLFIAFGEALDHLGVPARNGGVLRKGDCEDHQLAFSYYFQDPDGNHLEITTYDHAPVRDWAAGTGDADG